MANGDVMNQGAQMQAPSPGAQELGPRWGGAVHELGASFVRQGAAMYGGAMSQLTDNPAMLQASMQNAEQINAQLKTLWYQHKAKMFDGVYGENLKRQQGEVRAQYDEEIRMHQMPYTSDEERQANDPEAAPVVPRKGFRIIDPVTGEASYIAADSRDAIDHYSSATERYFAGMEASASEYHTATQQYQDNPYILAKGEAVRQAVTGQIEAMKTASDLANDRSQREYQGAMIGQATAATEDRQEQKAIDAEVGRQLAPAGGPEMTDPEARVAGGVAKATQKFDTAQMELTEQETKDEAAAQAGQEALKRVDPERAAWFAENYDPENPAHIKELTLAAIKKARYDAKVDRLGRGNNITMLDRDIRPEDVPGIMSTHEEVGFRVQAAATQSKAKRDSLVTSQAHSYAKQRLSEYKKFKPGSDEAERSPYYKDKKQKPVTPAMLDTLMSRIRGVIAPDGDFDFNPELVQTIPGYLEDKSLIDDLIKVWADADASIGRPSNAFFERQAQAEILSALISKSPEWREKWIPEGMSVEEFKGTHLALIFPKYVPLDIRSPVSESNNVVSGLALDREDPAIQGPVMQKLQIEIEQNTEAAQNHRPPVEDLRSALVLSNKSVSSFLIPDASLYESAIKTLQDEKSALEVLLITNSQNTVVTDVMLENAGSESDLQRSADMTASRIAELNSTLKLVNESIKKLEKSLKKISKLGASRKERGILGLTIPEAAGALWQSRGAAGRRIEEANQRDEERFSRAREVRGRGLLK